MTGPGDQRLRPFFALTLLLSLPFYALGAVLPRSVLPMQIPYAAVMVVCPMLAALWLWRRQGARFRISRILDTHAIRRPWVAALGVAGLTGAVLIAGRLSGGEAGAG
ncbi:MAG: hypothetical protein Q4G49_17890, partial [Paracoccus sp. (in: a-proteobacteria)]|nr:hypothetical protein [Paracoccus sp. (in: a-proteobacteria)]